MKWKKDTCHNKIVGALRTCGCAVLDLSKLGKGAPDVLCIRGDMKRLFEFKAEKGKFTPAQIKWQQDNPRMAQYYRVVKTVDEALREMGLL